MSQHYSILEGGCLCRAIRYQTTGTPYNRLHCHCSTCRKASGSAFMSWFTVRREQFAFTQGEPKYFASSQQVQRGFCQQCGTALTYQSQADEVDITIASLDRPEAIILEGHIWWEAKLPWIKLADGLPCYAQSRQ